MRSKCFMNKNGTRCKGEKVVEILQSPLPPPRESLETGP